MLLQSTARPRNAGVNEVVCNRQSSSESSSLFAFFYSILYRLLLPISSRWSWNRRASSSDTSISRFSKRLSIFYSLARKIAMFDSSESLSLSQDRRIRTFNQMNQKLQDSYEAFRGQETLNFVIVKSYVPAKGNSRLCNLAMIVTEPQNVLQTVRKLQASNL